MKTVLITGVAGFIGSHLCDALLRRGDWVVGVDNFDPYYSPAIKERNLLAAKLNPRFTLIRDDIRNREALRLIVSEVRPDVVVHLAAKAGVRPSLDDPNSYHDTNVIGTQNVLDACRAINLSHVVIASSSSVYGANRDVPFSESMDVSRVISPYAATKRMTELMGHVYHHLYGMQLTYLRFFTVYGPRQRPDMAISKFTRLIERGETVRMYGDGTSYRDYTYIDDIIDGVVRAVDTPLGYEILNLGENQTVALKYLLQCIGTCLKKTPIIEQLPMQPGDVLETFADISKAQQLLGYAPTTSIERGLSIYAQWYREISTPVQKKVVVNA